MRVTYRTEGVKSYWENRWANIPVDAPMENRDVYPLKYAEMIVHEAAGPILEAGCGAGRILRYYHNRGYDITGIDYVETVIEKLRQSDASLRVETGDITRLRFDNAAFSCILAFGLYHNLSEDDLPRAIAETLRVLKKGGKVCASFRADNIQTRLTDWLAERRKPRHSPIEHTKQFHKMNLTCAEYRGLFEKAGFVVESIFAVENMPILYKFSIFRAPAHKKFDENMARKEGYKLSRMGTMLQKALMRFFPHQFCNIYVLIAHRP